MTDTAVNAKRDNQPVRQYLTFVLWTAPFLLTVTFCNIMLVPKVEALLKATELEPDQLPRHFDTHLAILEFILNDCWIIVLVPVAIVMIPERLFSSWYRFRRYILVISAYIINALGLVTVGLLATIAVTLARIFAA